MPTWPRRISVCTASGLSITTTIAWLLRGSRIRRPSAAARDAALGPAAEGASRRGRRRRPALTSRPRRGCAVGDVVPLVEGGEVVAGQAAHRLRRAVGRQAVGVAAEDQPVEGGAGQIGRVLLLDLQAAQGLAAPALDLFGGEGGVEHDVGEQVEAEVELVGGHLRRWRRPRLGAGRRRRGRRPRSRSSRRSAAPSGWRCPW